MGKKGRKKRSREYLQNKKERGIKPGQVLNPEGKGGFGDHPENINAGGRPKNQESFVYWLNYFKTLPLKDFSKYKAKNPDICMAALAAWARVTKAIDKLEEFREVANRTEGMPTQRTELTGVDGHPIKIHSVNIDKLSKKEQEEFLGMYNKIVNPKKEDDT